MKFRVLFFVITIIMCVVFVFTGCDTSSSIKSEDTSSSTSNEGSILPYTEYFRFELNNDGKSYTVASVYRKCPTNIVVPEKYNGLPVTVIGRSAFAEIKQLESVVLPNTIVEIGNFAFGMCTALNEINIPDSVVAIRSEAFFYCRSLTEIVIPDSVQEIEVNAFGYCTSLERVSIGNNIKVIEDQTFYGCVALKEIKFPQNLEEIGSRAFFGCESLLLSDLPSSLKKIGESAFVNCYSITCLTLPESLQIIEEKAFAGCDCLFEICNKSSIEIEVGENANNFGASCLKRIIDDRSQSNIKIENDFMVYDDGEELILMKYLGDSEEVVFPEYPNDRKYTIYRRVFPVDNNIKSITLSKSVGYVREYAFQHCVHLESVTFDCEGAKIDYYAFYNSTNNVNLRKNVKNIYINAINIYESSYDYSFNYTNFSKVENIVFGNQITKVPDYFFCGSSSLQSVVFSSSVEDIGEGAFRDCINLKTIIMPEDIKITEIKDDTFQRCRIEQFVVPKSVTRIGKNAFSYTALKEISLPENLTVIDESAFAQCVLLESIKIPDSVEIIGKSAFGGCVKLTQVNVNETSSLHTIDEFAFGGCSNLKNIFLPKTLKNIAPYSFSSCERLMAFEMDPENPYYLVYEKNIYTKDFTVFVCKAPGNALTITIPSSVKKIGEGAFYTNKMKSLIFEEGSNLEIIGEKAFCYSGIQTIILPPSVRVIEEGAFSYCQVLESISFENGTHLERIEKDAFRGCYQLDSISIPLSVKFIGIGAFRGTLDDIYYEGTLEEWEKIVKEQGWLSTQFSVEIHCIDQTIVIE